MCSKPVVNTVARATSAALSLGASEAFGSNTVVGKIARTPGDLVTGGQGGGLINTALDAAKGAIIPKLPEPPVPTEDSTVEPPPTPNAPGSTSVDSLQAKRRKRLSQIRGGLASTIVTGPGGAQGVASLIAPQAGGLKLKLGA